MDPRVSIVIPVLNEAPSLQEIVDRLRAVVEPDTFEILFIDDGSTDDSWARIVEMNKVDPRVRGVRMRGNFGKSPALAAGFAATKGEEIITIDADLQDDPADIPTLRAKLATHDVVGGWRTTRRENLFRRMLTATFNGSVRAMTGVPLHDINCGLKAFKRDVVKTILVYGEMHRFLPILAAWNRFKVTEIPVHHHERKYGKSRYGFERLLRGFFDLFTVVFLTKFSTKPLHFFGRIGLFTGVVGVIIDLWLAIEWLFGHAIGNRPALLLGTILIVIGVQLFTFGLLAEFMNFDREQRRNTHPVRETVG